MGELPDWQSGLLFADRRPKPLAAVLPAPLHAERVDSQFVRLWGRVRPGRAGAGCGSRPPARTGPWRALVDGRTDRRGVVEAEEPARPGHEVQDREARGGRWVYGPPVREL